MTAVGQANIDALTILSLPADHPAASVARARGIRLVTTSANSDPDSSWVAIDDFGAGVMVGEHLANLGHRDDMSHRRDEPPAAGGQGSASTQLNWASSTMPPVLPVSARRSQGTL